jgi:hypothetical protein
MVPAPVVVGMRPLTPAESAHLDRLRDFLTGSRVDVHDAHALGALLDSQLARWQESGASELPEAMLAAFGIGIGDLVLAAAPAAQWVLRTSTDKPAPALLAAAGSAAVVPLDDVRARWTSGVRDWVPGYVTAAAHHLSTPAPPAPVAHAAAPAPPASPSAPAAHVPIVRESATAAPRAPQTPAAAPAESPASLPVRTHGAAAQPEREQAPTPAPMQAPTQAPAQAPTAQRSAFPTRRTSRVPRPHMPADLPVPPSIPVQILALRLLDQVLEIACASERQTDLAYAVVGADGSLRAAPDHDSARASLASSGAAVGAVVWIATLDEEGRVGGGTPAVIVEAGERGVETLVVGHRFTTRPVEDLVIVGQGAPLL